MPTASAIRELSAAKSPPRIAAAFFEETIQIWDLATSEQISEFESVFTCGGDRLALHPEGETCVAAGWIKGREGGVACYDAGEGTLRWHREDIRQTQFARFSRDGRMLWVGVEAGPLQVLEAATGMTIDKFVGVKAVFDNPYLNVLLLQARKRGYFLQGTNKVRIPNLSFALLDVAFSPNRVCVMSQAGPFAVWIVILDWSFGATTHRATAMSCDCATGQPISYFTAFSGNTRRERQER